MAKKKRSACRHPCLFILLWEHDDQTRAEWCMGCGAFRYAAWPGGPLGVWHTPQPPAYVGRPWTTSPQSDPMHIKVRAVKPKRARKRKARRAKA